jgi:hypothetical protein
MSIETTFKINDDFLPSDGLPPREYILALARTFPCLRKKLHGMQPRHFDADKLYEASGPWSHGEQLCVLFILNVWNHSDARSKGYSFDLFEFMGIADAANRQPVLDWIQTPHWP